MPLWEAPFQSRASPIRIGPTIDARSRSIDASSRDGRPCVFWQSAWTTERTPSLGGSLLRER